MKKTTQKVNIVIDKADVEEPLKNDREVDFDDIQNYDISKIVNECKYHKKQIF